MTTMTQPINGQKNQALVTVKGTVKLRQRRKITPETILDLRKRLNMNQRRFAGLLGVSQLSITSWETGKVKPQKQSRRRILSVWKQLDEGHVVEGFKTRMRPQTAKAPIPTPAVDPRPIADQLILIIKTAYSALNDIYAEVK
jgi:DNA-binding transcriptional regulator YiaG